MKKPLLFTLLSILVFSFLGARQPAQASVLPASKIDLAVQANLANLQANEMTTVIVTLRQQADLRQIAGANKAARRRLVIRALQLLAASGQRPLRALLRTRQEQGKVAQVTPFWIANSLSVTATAQVIQELAARAEVKTVSADAIAIVPASPSAVPIAAAAPFAAAAPGPNLALINVPAVWSLGDYGQGVVVANMDSGVDASHPDLAGTWRGGSNSWFDPYNQHPTTPTDLTGHGTWTMGVMVGGDSGGTAIGIAPQARWIAVKIFNDAGSATATAIHQGYQWLLDPDGDPNTADAPDVVNNSWAFGTPGCNLEFQLDLQALRAAGILPVFAAGNYGPGGSTSVSPANYPEAFAVGATTNLDRIYGTSSRGPSACGEPQTIYPELVAPGVNITTSDLFGLYSQNSGTSLSAPHAAGALALLLSAFPNLDAGQQAAALTNSAQDLGTAGADNTFGYGRLNVLAAYQALAGGQPAPTATIPPPPTDTATVTPPPTDTATVTPPPTATATLPPPPTATATLPPTSTATVAPTPTATATTAPANTLHSGDLDRSASLAGSKWNATVTLYVHNASEQPVANVKVSVSWSNGTSGTASCTTNASGSCLITKTGLSLTTASVKLKVTNLTRSGFTYTAAANHDPDGESDGTSITVMRP